jgi:deoxyadenosine/deoxycytidine kinase
MELMNELSLSLLEFETYRKKVKSVKIISIEGSIGAGKSTFIESLEKLGIEFVELVKEPSDRWEKEKALGTEDSMITSFYNDKKANGGIFQLYALITRLIRLVKVINATEKPLILVERCPHSDKNCFFDTNFELGNINGSAATVYSLYYQVFENLFEFKPNAFVFLNADTKTCSDRIRERLGNNELRDAESTIDIQYLETLDKAHRKWLAGEKNVLTLDASKNYRDDETITRDYFNQIMKFVEGIC